MAEKQNRGDWQVVAYIYGDTEPVKESIRAAIKAKNVSSMSRLKKSRTTRAANDTSDAGCEDAAAREDASRQLEKDPCFPVTFSEPLKSKGGFVIGSDSKDADLVIVGAPGLSGRHFALTFDTSNELVVRDLSSTTGTRLVYGRKDTEIGEVGDLVMEVESCAGIKVWSARGPKVTNGAPVQIQATSEAKFRIIVPNHNKKSRRYMSKVESFLEGEPKDLPLQYMSLSSRRRTMCSTGLKTPVVKEGSSLPNGSFWKKKLSSGRCSVVHYYWNVTTREAFAINEPVHATPVQLEKWKKEAGVLQGLHHIRIVRPSSSGLEPHPRLLFGYSEYGTLFHYIADSPTHHNAQVAIQLLEALKFLHAEGLIHRDVKPANVLVCERDEGKIQVKLADFGLARAEGDDFVSAPHYGAPEIIDGKIYNSRVDIWSLGTLLVHLQCGGLPKSHSQSPSSPTVNSDTHIPPTIALETHSSPCRTTDCLESPGQMLIKFGEEKNSKPANPILSFALKFMLLIDPKQRLPTPACLDLAKNWLGGVVSTPASLDPVKQCEKAAEALEKQLEHPGRIERTSFPISKRWTSRPSSRLSRGRKTTLNQVRRPIPPPFTLHHQRVPYGIADEIQHKVNEMGETVSKDCDGEGCLPSESNCLELELSRQLEAADKELPASRRIVEESIEPEIGSTRLKRRRQEGADSELRPSLMADGQESPATKRIRKGSFEAELDPDRMTEEQEFPAT